MKINKQDIINFINSLPQDLSIPLKNDMFVSLKPYQIIEEIDKKSNIGKKYFIQMGKAYKKPRNNDINSVIII